MKKNKNRKSWRIIAAVSIALSLTGNAAFSQEQETAPKRSLQVNLQAHGNFSELFYDKNSSLVQSLPLSTFTIEGSGMDKIGSTYFFVDLEVGNASNLKNKMLGGTYIEFAREWCFWGKSKAAALTIHTEFDAGVGYGGDSWGSTGNGFEFKTALLGGLSYSWFGDKYFFQIQALNRYELKDYYGWGGEGWQLTFVYSYEPVKWFTLAGYADFWQNPIDGTGVKSLKRERSFHFAIEPYVWFNITDYFSIGSRLRFTYNNYMGLVDELENIVDYDRKAYFAPTIALKWNMN